MAKEFLRFIVAGFRKRIILPIVLVSVVVVSLIGVVIGCLVQTQPIVVTAYSESTTTVHNPGIGYSTTLWYNCAPGNTPVHNPSGDLVLMFINIGQFSSGVNGSTDYDLDETFFTNLRATFTNCRRNGATIAVRFRYDDNGVANPEPATFDWVLRHIASIKSSNLFVDFQDIVMFVESGFVGKWGEQHGGKYTSLEYKAQLLTSLLDAIPAPIPVTVRTPSTYATWAGIKLSDIATATVDKADAYRVGIYNDGYLGSDSDLGTYSNREIETTWLGQQTQAYFGGEFSENFEFAQQYSAYQPDVAIPEMYRTHLSYINGNIFNIYKDMIYNKNYDFNGLNRAYYGQSVWQFIRDHLGYRFVWQGSKISSNVTAGKTFDLEFTVTNNGFANLQKKQDCFIILANESGYIQTPVTIDPRTWQSQQTVTEKLTLKIPGFISGRWNIYFQSSFGNDVASMQPRQRSLQFANDNVYHGSLAGNYLGQINVKAINDTVALQDDTFYQIGQPAQSVALQRSKVQIDGAIDKFEWLENETIITADNGNLWLRTDTENLYFGAVLTHQAEAPVFNLRLTNATNNETYWIYFQSNGYIYYNKGENSGAKIGYNDTALEMKIPRAMLGLTDGGTISALRLFIQDSKNKWDVTNELNLTTPIEIC